MGQLMLKIKIMAFAKMAQLEFCCISLDKQWWVGVSRETYITADILLSSCHLKNISENINIERQRDTETKRHGGKDTRRQRDTEKERQRNREPDRHGDKDMETERGEDRATETKRQGDSKTWR